MDVEVGTVRHAADVKARGVPPRWGLCAAAFLAGSLLVGLAVGPVGIGAGAIVDSALSHLPLLHVHSSLDATRSGALLKKQ